MFFNPVPGAWALACGEKIHHDFYSAIGITYYLPALAAIKVWGPTLQIVHQSNALLFVVASLLAAWLLRPSKGGLAFCALGTMLVSLAAACPLYFNDAPFVIKEGTMDWPCIACLMLCLITPLAGALTKLDIALIGGVIVWILFSKLSYVPVALLLVAAGVWTARSGKRWRQIIGVLVASVAGMFLFALVFNVNIGEMYRNFSFAGHLRYVYNTQCFSHVGIEDNFGRVGFAALFVRGEEILSHNQLELAALLLPAFLFERRGVALMLSGLMLLDIAEGLINTQGMALPFLPLAWLALYKLAANSRIRFISLLVLAGHLLFMGTGYASEFAYACHPPKVATIDSTCGKNVFMLGNNRANELNVGLAMLRQTGHTNAVASLETVNLFPLLLNTRPPKGQPSTYAYWVTFEPQHYESADRLFKNVQTVMIPKSSPCPAQNGTLVLIYQDYLRTNFLYGAENQYWIMLSRNK